MNIFYIADHKFIPSAHLDSADRFLLSVSKKIHLRLRALLLAALLSNVVFQKETNNHNNWKINDKQKKIKSTLHVLKLFLCFGC